MLDDVRAACRRLLGAPLFALSAIGMIASAAYNRPSG